MSNAASDAYAAWPERIYIIDESGRIAYRGGMGPFNYKPEEAREWLAARYGAGKHDAPKTPAGAAPPTPGPPAPAKRTNPWNRKPANKNGKPARLKKGGLRGRTRKSA